MTDLQADDVAREKWNSIYRKARDEQPLPCSVLNDFSYLLPSMGKALDIACGRGGNALFLASCGLSTTAIDISDAAIETLQRYAAGQSLELNATVAAVSDAYFADNEHHHKAYDVIVVANYLDRKLLSVLPDLLAPNGLLFYQTFVSDKSDPGNGPSNPEFLLEANELLTLTQSLVCRVFYDLGTTGAADYGMRNQSCIVVQKGV